ncbi:hypothetical protein [Lentisalinibacter orientalis]|uniref:hypothetical protein n=1 Tax=Lentisalinibacter orientalis TaxID=2992241 RepID=UPI003865A034
MSKPKPGAEEQLALFKTEETRERWRWVHEAIAYAKEANRTAMLMAEDPPRDSRPALRRVR